MKIGIDRKILAGFALCCVVLLVVALISFNNSGKVVESGAHVAHTHEVIYVFQNVLADAIDSESASRGFVITANEDYLLRYSEAKANILVHLAKARALTTDNPIQQKNISQLTDHIAMHQSHIDNGIAVRRKTNDVAAAELIQATHETKRILNEIRSQISAALAIEKQLLADRKLVSDKSGEEFSIVFAGLIAVIVIILGAMYLIVTTNIKALRKLEKQANDNNWVLLGTENLMKAMQDDKTIPVLGKDILACLATYLKIPLGSFYVADPGNSSLRLEATFSAAGKFPGRTIIPFGEGLAGQVAASQKAIQLDHVDPGQFQVSTTFGGVIPKYIIAFPFIVDGRVGGVIELGSLEPWTDQHKKFLGIISDSVAIAVKSSIARDVVQNLLDETQRQSEELETQSEELRQFNEELHAKTDMLERSEEELTRQQTELEIANIDLEEKASTLEEQKRALEDAKAEIERKAQEVEISSRYKSEFLANMSHELRTPLNSILILSQLLAENKNNTLATKEVEFANNIHTSGASLLELINDILDLSKIEAGKMELDIESCQVSDLVHTVHGMVSGIAIAKSINFTVHIDPQLRNATVNTDRQRVEQILRNLLSNAIKFTPPHGMVMLQVLKPSGDIKPKNNVMLKDKQVVMFCVKDSGIGIPLDKQSVIFEAFQQADGSTKRKFGGTGLGLSISKELAGALGGEIQLISREGKGSTFILFLPMEYEISMNTINTREVSVKEKELPALRLDKDDSHDEHMPAIPDDRNSIQPHHKVIVVIEDDEKFAKVLLEFIRERGYKGVVATQGNTGLSYARTYKPVAILLDVNLPVMDGNEVLRQIKNDPGLRHIPVQIISAFDTKKHGMSLGAFDYLSKPVSIEKLNQAFVRIENFTNKKLKKLLVVEDDEQQNRMIRELIEGADIKTISAHTGEEAYRMLEDEGADCIIVDLGLAEMSGFQLMEKIRANEKLNRIPIIVYTGKDLKKEDTNRLNKLADTVVLKTANSPARLLDETILFLHRVESQLPKDKQSIIRSLHKTDEILKDKKILMVDDDIRNIYSLTNALEDEGLICITAENGRVAVETLKQDPSIDLVLMDVMMPEMDGYEATQEIRKLDQFRKLPIIALTAKAMKGDREKCLAVGMSDYVSKPVDIAQLLSLMRVWLYK